jgi:hypothetical protein
MQYELDKAHSEIATLKMLTKKLESQLEGEKRRETNPDSVQDQSLSV